jgi:hypothetical protein
MAEQLTEFMESGDAAWDITNDDHVIYELLRAYPDVLYIRNKDNTYLINRSYLSKPKILDPSLNGGIENDNGTA